MFSSGPKYSKLKTNLRLALNRLKLLEKKKTELAQKARKEIADYLANNKVERARIRVEHIIREDYLVEAMEVVEMYCDMVLARFGLITQMKELDEGIAEAVYSLVWVCPRLQTDVCELKVIADIFAEKYGPQFTESARTATGDHHVSEKLMHKLQLQAPPKLLVEKYLIEIAKIYNIEYVPDPQVMQDESKKDQHLIDLSDRNNLGGGGGNGGDGGMAPPQMGFIGYPSVPPLPTMPDTNVNSKIFNYPPAFRGAGGPSGSGGGAGSGGNAPSAPFSYNILPTNVPTASGGDPEPKDLNTKFINKEMNTLPNEGAAASSNRNTSPDENILRPKVHDDPPPRYSSINPVNLQDGNKPKPQPRMKMPSPAARPAGLAELPNLPNVPNDLPEPNTNAGAGAEDDDEIDFDSLSRRFENLKKH